MKWFAIILSLYMTILAMLPCKDKDDFSTVVNRTAVSTTHKNDPGSCQETCPPFCNCNCCSTSRNLARTYTVLNVYEQPISQNYSELRVEPLRDQALPIWQPPQLS
ncbi:DUF6660 family protein [Mucilaginibacter sp. Mucisp86]|uniref:DUF6660 family protein n=1 Tax=Mucilaginibacter sp. Mucisp86 TaxID=3243060 RepID=UPI0039B56966